MVIIEDEYFAAEHLSLLVSDLNFEVAGVYHSGEEFLEQIDWNFDIALLDILLSGEITGLDLASEVKKQRKPFVFITANKDTETLKVAAKLGPSGYITKPFEPNDVVAALEILVHQLPKPLRLNTRNGERMIDPAEIVFIKSDGAYVNIQTRSENIIQRKLLKDIEDELPNSFIRVHRSYLVNKDFIEQKNAVSISLLNHQVPVSRTYKENLDNL